MYLKTQTQFMMLLRDRVYAQVPPQPPKLKLELDDPDIQGIMASVKGTETRFGALNSSSKFTAKLMKQGDKWVIQGGIF